MRLIEFFIWVLNYCLDLDMQVGQILAEQSLCILKEKAKLNSYALTI